MHLHATEERKLKVMQESKETQRAGETLAVPSAHWVTFVQSLNFQVFKCLQLRQERAAKTKSPL